MKVDFDHFWPRYGLATAICHANESRVSIQGFSEQELAELLAKTIENELGYVTLYTKNRPDQDDDLLFEYLSRDKVNPGKDVDGVKQNAANGYYLSPHVATSNNAADIVENAKAIINVLRSAKMKLNSSIELKKSFAPLVSKINNGKPSMSNPKVGLYEAACTMIATLTHSKPGSFYDSNNHVLIPDLPMYEESTHHEPLRDFIYVFDELLDNNQEQGRYVATLGKNKKKKAFRRPPIFQGNYPNAPRDGILGPLSVLAAIGLWAQEGESFRGDPRGAFAERVLEALTRNPLYVVSYDGRKQQEHFGHHLVALAMDSKYQFSRLISSIGRIRLHSNDAQNVQLFRIQAARFLQSFQPAAFRDFLAFRAEYESVFTNILEEYFMSITMKDLPLERRKEIVISARAFGSALNYAAYRAACDEVAQDKKRGRAARSESEYKARKLIVLESTAFSAKTHLALLAQLSTMAGRQTGGHDLWHEAKVYMEAVAAQEISLEEAKQLAIAFIRLRPSGKSGDTQTSDLAEAQTDNISEDDPINDPLPEEIN